MRTSEPLLPRRRDACPPPDAIDGDESSRRLGRRDAVKQGIGEEGVRGGAKGKRDRRRSKNSPEDEETAASRRAEKQAAGRGAASDGATSEEPKFQYAEVDALEPKWRAWVSMPMIKGRREASSRRSAVLDGEDRCGQRPSDLR